MALSTAEYNRVDIRHQAELLNVKRENKISILSRYLSQAGELLGLLGTITDKEANDRSLLVRRFAAIDIETENFNPRISPVLFAGVGAVINLGVNHTVDYPVINNISATISVDVNANVLTAIQQPIPKSPFRLSEAIWSKEKRDVIYRQVLQGVNR